MPRLSVGCGVSAAGLLHSAASPAVITAALAPAMSALAEGQAVGDVTGYAIMTDPSNFASAAGAVTGVTVVFTGDAVDAVSPMSAGQSAGFAVTVSDSAGNTRVFAAGPVMVASLPPAVDTPPVITGAPVVGERLSGTFATFTGSGLSETHAWETSGDGVTGWAGTGDAGTLGPVMADGRHYRLVSAAGNAAGTVTSISNVIGPVVTPSISISGLTLGEAVEGNHAAIAMAATAGTITARKWGSSAGGTQYGTGESPTDFTGGTTLHATATIGGFDYAASAPVAGVSSVITAIVIPQMSPLVDGQAMQEVLNWTLFTDTANYSSTMGAIVSAFPSFTGDALAADTVLSEGDTAGFNIAVTDSEGNGRNFPASQITVEYRVNVTETGGGVLDIQVNPIVPDSMALGDIVVSGSGAYNGTYTGITAGDVRYGPYNLGNWGSTGLPTISGTPGGVLTGDHGAWGTPTGTTLTLTPRWLVDGVVAAGEAGTTIDSSVYPGTVIQFAPQGSDGTTTAIATSAGVGIPGLPLVVTVDSTGFGSSGSTGTGNLTSTISDAEAGDEIYVLVDYGTFNGTTPHTFAIGALSVSEVEYEFGGTSNHCGIYKATALATGSLTLTMSVAGGQSWRGCSWRAYIVKGRGTADDPISDVDSWPNSLSLDRNVQNGDVVLACAVMAANGDTGDFIPTGLSEEVVGGYIDVQANRCHFFYRADPTSPQNPRPMTLAPTGNGTGQLLACAVRIRA